VKDLINQYLNFEQQRLIIVCTSVVATAAVVMYLLLPNYRAHEATTLSANNLRSQLRSATIPATEISRLRRDIDYYSAQLEASQMEADPKQAEAMLLQHLHNTAQAHQLTLLRIAPQRGQLTEQMLELRFNLEVLGSYANTANWLETLDTQSQNIVLQAFEIGSESSDGAALHTKATVLAYQTQGVQS